MKTTESITGCQQVGEPRRPLRAMTWMGDDERMSVWEDGSVVVQKFDRRPGQMRWVTVEQYAPGEAGDAWKRFGGSDS